MTAGGPRILLYSHDSYGLGHLRRTMLIAERLVRLPCRPEVLVVTGSPRAQSFSVPSRVDTVKLPAATKDGDRYRSRTLELPIDDLVALRAELDSRRGEIVPPRHRARRPHARRTLR